MSEHGTASRYGNQGCRCEACRAAHAQQQRSRGYSLTSQRKRYTERVEIDGRMVHPKPHGGHGSVSAYTNCGCRCDPCRTAYREYQRQHRTRTA